MIRIPSARWATPLLALGVLAVAGCDDDDDPVGPDDGTLRVVVTSTGTPADPDGFTVTIDGEDAGDIAAAGGTLPDQELAEGDYEVELTGLADNCTVAGENPRTVSVTDGDITTTTFAVTCAASTGTVAATTTTTGDNIDADGYLVSVNGGTPEAIGVNATLDLTDVAAGDATVELSDIAPNCDVTGENPMTVTVVGGASTPAAFVVTCALNTGSAEVTTTTTGTNQDADGYTLTVDGGTPIDIEAVNGTIMVRNLPAGDHLFSLGGVAANCTVTGGTDQTITVVDQQTAAVDYAVTCT